MTELKPYLKAHGKTISSFARDLGISRSYLDEVATHKKSPSLRVAVLIERATDGDFPCDFWVKEDPPLPTKQRGSVANSGTDVNSSEDSDNVSTG